MREDLRSSVESEEQYEIKTNKELLDEEDLIITTKKKDSFDGKITENIINDGPRDLNLILDDKREVVKEVIEKDVPKFSDIIAKEKERDPEGYRYNETRTKDQVRQASNQSKETLRQMENDRSIPYYQKRAAETNNFINSSSRLVNDKKWYRLFDGESEEMTTVKDTITYLNNFLSTPISKYFKGEGEDRYFDSIAMQKAMDRAFDNAIKACNIYIAAKKAQGEKTRSTGVRRLEKVREMLFLCEQEKIKYSFLVDAIKTGDLKDFDEKGVEALAPKELTTKHLTAEAITCKWQNQGNSTDVYRITVMEDGEEKVYYIKENLPLISADIEGFLDRRIAQLEASREHIGDKDLEEDRMRKSGMKDADYDACLTLLRTMKQEIAHASGEDKEKLKKKYINFFAHDFDKMFTQCSIHNKAARLLAEEEKAGVGFDLSKWESYAQDENHPLYEPAKYILKACKAISGEDQKKGAEPKKKADEPKKQVARPVIGLKSTYQWAVDKLGLNKDKTLKAVLQNIYNQEHDDRRIEDLFRISLGKEVELFGQMRDRSKGDDREIAAQNNTATHVLSNMMGFNDVITKSKTKIVKFLNREGKMVETFCTVIDEAKGQEFIEILKDARKSGKKIGYSPEAVRELIRLQAFDTLCLQVDRHGRNFKCETKEVGGQIIITKILSYDHDMSQGEKTLKDTFKDGSAKKGFLPNPTKKIKKDSAEYNYVMTRYFGYKKQTQVVGGAQKDTDWEAWRQKTGLRADVLKKFFTAPLLSNQFAIVGVTKIPQENDRYNNYYGKIIDKNTNKALSEEEQEEVVRQLTETNQKLFDVLFDKSKRNKGLQGINRLRTDFTDDQWKETMRNINVLTELMEKYDFTHIQHKDISRKEGLVQFWLEQFTYAYLSLDQAKRAAAEAQKQAGKKDKKGKDQLKQEAIFIDGQKYSAEEEHRRREAMKLLTDKDGNLEIPALLHYDKEAYEAIRDLTVPARMKDAEARLKALNFRQSKIDYLKTRAGEIVEDIKIAKKKAEAFYVLAGYKGIKAQFFLEENDYGDFDSIDDFAADPGQTYLSISNDKYLYGKKEFTKNATEKEKAQAFHEEKLVHHDKKLWDDQSYGRKQGNVEDQNSLYDNPLQGNLVKVKRDAPKVKKDIRDIRNYDELSGREVYKIARKNPMNQLGSKESKKLYGRFFQYDGTKNMPMYSNQYATYFQSGNGARINLYVRDPKACEKLMKEEVIFKELDYDMAFNSYDELDKKGKEAIDSQYKAWEKTAKERIDMLRQATKQDSIPRDTKLYRMTGNYIFDKLGIDIKGKTNAQIVEEINQKKGATFKEDTFTSTGYKVDNFYEFLDMPVMMTILCEKGKKCFFTANLREAEVLFDRAEFEVISASVAKNVPVPLSDPKLRIKKNGDVEDEEDITGVYKKGISLVVRLVGSEGDK